MTLLSGVTNFIYVIVSFLSDINCSDIVLLQVVPCSVQYFNSLTLITFV